MSIINLSLVEHRCNFRVCSISQNRLYLLPGSFFNKFLNLQAFICPLLSTNSSPIHVQYHKTSYVLLLGYLFQFLKADKNWYVLCWAPMKSPPLFNNKLQAVLHWLEMFYNLFLQFKALMCPLFSTNTTPLHVKYHKSSCIYFLGIYSNWFLNWQ